MLSKATVVGTGAMGTIAAQILAHNGAHVALLGRRPELVQQMLATRENRTHLPGMRLSERVYPTIYPALALRNRTTLGIAQAADALNIGLGATAVWGTETVTGSSILIKYTYIGDANLSEAVLCATDLTDTNLTRAIFSGTIFANLDLRKARGLVLARHESASSIAIDTLIASQGQIPEIFLKRCGLTADVPLMAWIKQLRAQFALFRVHRADQDDAGFMCE